MKKEAIFVFVILALSVALMAENAGKVILIGGDGVLFCDNKKIEAGSFVPYNSPIRTGEKSYAKLRLFCGEGAIAEIYVRKSTKIKIRKKVKHYKNGIKLVLGRIWALFKRSNKKNSFAVETFNSVAGVEGTEFVVQYRDKQTGLWVMSGKVRHQPLRKMPPGVPPKLLPGKLVTAGSWSLVDEKGSLLMKGLHGYPAGNYGEFAKNIEKKSDSFQAREIEIAKVEEENSISPEENEDIDVSISPEELATPDSQELKIKIYGDFNGDGVINATDLSFLSNHLRELKKVSPKKGKLLSSEQLKAADIVCDGKIDARDRNILKYVIDHSLDFNNDGRWSKEDTKIIENAVKTNSKDEKFDIIPDGKIDIRDVSAADLMIMKVEKSLLGQRI